MMTMSIGSFLIDRLVCLGASHIYGVQGDYNLEFLYLLKNSKRLSFVGTCNELNAGYAADGGARLIGISVVLTTYGVDDLAACSAPAPMRRVCPCCRFPARRRCVPSGRRRFSITR
jgi:indolepyruvate decarboxylase